MIVTKVIKILPTMNDHLKHVKTAEEYNALSHALYNFFNSEVLTKNDYIFLVDLLHDKLPVYQLNGDLTQYKTIVLLYSNHNYPPCEDFARVIDGLLTSTPALNLNLLNYALFTLKEKLPRCTNFVGVEVLKGRTISLSDITQEELKTIKAIVGSK